MIRFFFFFLINLSVHQAGRRKHVQSQTRGREEISIFGERRRMREMRVCESVNGRSESVCVLCQPPSVCQSTSRKLRREEAAGVARAHTSALIPPSAGHTQTFANARLCFVRLAHLKPSETRAKPADAIAVSFCIAPACDATRLMFAVRRARCKVGAFSAAFRVSDAFIRLWQSRNK